MKKRIFAMVLALMVTACALTALAEAQLAVVNGMVVTPENGSVTAETAVDGETGALPAGEMTVKDSLVHQGSGAGAGVRVQSVAGGNSVQLVLTGSRSSGGSGLGLYLLGCIAERHGMRTRVCNTEDGVCFQLLWDV